MKKAWEIDKRHRHPNDARTNFERWVFEQGGTSAVAAMFGLHYLTVNSWLARRTAPSLSIAVGILTKAKGQLSIDDIHEATKAW